MIYLYRLLAYLVYGVTYPYGRVKATQGDLLWQGRLARTRLPQTDIWMHAASVGEVRVISYLINFLQHANPDLRLHLTVMTRSGFETARAVCNKKVLISFLPFDVPILWRKIIAQLRPKAVVVAETEIWPNLIVELKLAGIPLILVNGRISEKGFERYRALRGSFLPLLSSYDHFFVKGSEDLARFQQLGVLSAHMTLAGDMKFDAPLIERSDSQTAQCRTTLGISGNACLLVAGSTRDGEEEQLLACYRALLHEYPTLRLVLVPRHIERAGVIKAVVEQAGFIPYVATEPAPETDNPVVIVDRMGILIDCYATADIAFVGGTLVDIGGHNLLEPVWAGTPVLFGPSITNVRDAAEYIIAHDYGMMVHSAEHLAQSLREILSGQRSFATKTKADFEHSATAQAGNYILARMRHA